MQGVAENQPTPSDLDVWGFAHARPSSQDLGQPSISSQAGAQGPYNPHVHLMFGPAQGRAARPKSASVCAVPACVTSLVQQKLQWSTSFSFTILLPHLPHRSLRCVGPGQSYLDQLHDSRTFNSPDCVEAMAAAWGVQGALDHLQVSHLMHCTAAAISSVLQQYVIGAPLALHLHSPRMHCHVLQGSAVHPRLDPWRQEHVQSLRTLLKGSIRSAWAKVCPQACAADRAPDAAHCAVTHRLTEHVLAGGSEGGRCACKEAGLRCCT